MNNSYHVVLRREKKTHNLLFIHTIKISNYALCMVDYSLYTNIVHVYYIVYKDLRIVFKLLSKLSD